MARGLAFHYFPGTSPLHRWDARCKLPALAIVTLSMLHMETSSLIFFSALFVVASAVARLPWRSFLLNIKPWLPLLLVIFAARALFHQPSSAGSLPSSPTLQGIRIAAMICWQLVLMLGYAILFTSVTKPSEMQEALTWLLKPVPLVPERRVAMMVSLTVRFFPMVLDQYAEIRMAIKSRRGLGAGKLLRRVRHLVLPLFRRSFLHSEQIALALAARGYREDLPIRSRKIPFGHITALGLLALVTLASVHATTIWSYFYH